MYSTARRFWLFIVGSVCVTLVSPAQAWVEASVESQLVTVEMDRQGKAQVTHELLLNVRGGPLESYTLSGVDSDAIPLPDAKAVDRRAEDTAGVPLLATRLPDGSLKLSVIEGKGLMRGSYLVRFGYQTDLLGRGLLRAEVGHAELNWKGPKLSDGVDSAKAIFRFPRADQAPSLPKQDLERAALGLDPALAGVFVSNLVRGQRYDEVEVIRLHIAAREAPVYQLWSSLDAFSEFAHVPSTPAESPTAPKQGHAPLLAALLSGLAALLLSLAKFRESGRAARDSGGKLSALIRGPLGARVLGIGLLIGASTGCILGTQAPLLGLLGTFLAYALLWHRLPPLGPTLRGPGAWQAVTLRALAAPPVVRKHSPYSSTTWLGRLILGALVVAGSGALLLVPGGVLERTLCGLVWLIYLLGTFTSGTPSASTQGVSQMRARELLWQAKALAKKKGVQVQVLGRYTAKGTQIDDIRLRALPDRAKPGLLGVELGSILGAGDVLQPYVLVRVLDGSVAQRSLPRSLIWMRGRTSEERVAIVSPRLPVRSATRRLMLELLELTKEGAAQARKPSQKASMSAGIGARTSNSRMPAPPAKAA